MRSIQEYLYKKTRGQSRSHNRFLFREGGPGSGIKGHTTFHPDEGKGQFSGQVNFKQLHNFKQIAQTIDNAMAKIPAHVHKKLNTIAGKFKAGNDSKRKHTNNGEYTFERKALHKQIISKFLGNKPTNVSNPSVLMLAGIPGSGKTTAAKQFISEDSVYINSDDIKEMLPEYKESPLNASLVHAESNDILKQLINIATTNKMSIIADATFNRKDKSLAIIKNFKNKGYKISMIATQLPTHKSIERASKRFERTGRFVPFHYISDAGERYFDTINTIKKEVGDFKMFDTDTAFGDKPIRIEKLNQNNKRSEIDDMYEEMEDSVLDMFMENNQ